MQEKDSELGDRLRQALQELEGCEARWRHIVSQSPQGILIVDTDGNVRFANEAAAAIFGCRAEGLLGDHFELPAVSDKPAELSLKSRDGRTVAVEMWRMETEWEGSPAWFVALRDTTERKRVEEALLESRNRAEAIIASSLDAVVEIDEYGTILAWNPKAEEIFGWTAEEAIGSRPSENIVPGKYREAHEKGLKHFRATGEGPILNKRIELTALNRDGQEFPIELTVAPIRRGSAYTFTAFLRDITERNRAEEALRLSEARYRALHRDNPAMIATLDDELTILSVNPSCARQLGYTMGELEGRPVLKIFHEDDRPAVAEQLRMCLRNPDQVYRWQFRKIRKDGGLLWVEELAQTVYDLNGALNILVVCQDITERKQAEEALQESEERFRATFNQVAVGIGHVAPDGRWLRINQKYCDIVGYTEEELKALTIEDITHPDDREASLKNFRLLLEGKLDYYSLEKRYIRKDGSTIWVNLTASMVTDADGNQRFAVGVAEDITSRKRTEEALQKSEKKFSKIFHSAPALIGISTLVEGRIIDINETGLLTLGYRREEMIGRTLLELGILENPAERGRVERMLLEQGPVRNHEIDFRGKTGERFTGLLSAELIDMNGERYILAMIRDITQRKRAVEEIEKLNSDLAARALELESANVELEAFNYTVAHDLRKPLTVINGYCQAIMALCGDRFDEKCRGYLQEAYEGTLHMNRLIDALLDFSRLAHCEVHPESVDLSAMAGEIAAELRLADPDRHGRFVIAEGVSAEGDQALLRMVLENLIGNAWKYTAKRQVPRIEFGMTEVDGRQACFVRDNGTGFDMGYAEKLFTPFQRLPGTDEFKGHGIGLATVERIIRRHGGRVWAEGETGKGATFYFTLSEDGTLSRA